MTAAIIGGNGFVGRNLASRLINENIKTWVIYKNNHHLIPEGCEKIEVSRLGTIKIKFDLVFFTMGNYALSYEESVAQHLFINKALTELKYEKVIFVSSVAVYGCHKKTISVNSPFNDPSLYGLSKIANEFLVSSVSNYAIIRFTYLYGPGMNLNSLIPRWVNNAISEKKIVIFGDGNRAQDYLHIDDAVSLCVRAAQAKKNLKLVGASSNSVSNLQLAGEIANVIPGTGIQQEGIDLSCSYTFDISDTINETGWQPHVNFKAGLRNYIEHACADL